MSYESESSQSEKNESSTTLRWTAFAHQSRHFVVRTDTDGVIGRGRSAASGGDAVHSGHHQQQSAHPERGASRRRGARLVRLGLCGTAEVNGVRQRSVMTGSVCVCVGGGGVECIYWQTTPARCVFHRICTSKCMHGMNQSEAEYSKPGKRSQRASLSQIGPVVLEV